MRADPDADIAPVSVVIPTYNGAQFLGRTLASVGAQTVKPAQVIVVDDGSSDQSATVAADWGATVIQQANGGISSARNAGIRASNQEFIALLDHDDEWAPQKLARQLEAARLFPEAVAIVTDVEKRYRTGQLLDSSFLNRDAVHLENLTTHAAKLDVTLHRNAADELASMGWFLLPSATLFRRETLIAAGMFSEALVRAEDVDCFLRVLQRGPLVLIRCPLTQWLIHDINSHADDFAGANGVVMLAALMQRKPDAYPATYRTRIMQERATFLPVLARCHLERGERLLALRASVQAVLAGQVAAGMKTVLMIPLSGAFRERTLRAIRKL